MYDKVLLFCACCAIASGEWAFAATKREPSRVTAGIGSQASAVPLPSSYQGPLRIDLSGKWDFRFDPEGSGERDNWFAVSVAGPWKKANVPGSFNQDFAANPNHPSITDTYLFYKGKAWYRTRFQSPRSGADSILHFSGTVLRQKVWLNGKPVGTSDLPYLGVSYDVSGLLLRSGENTLVVEVDNSILPNAIPDAKWRGWWDDGGLIWPVYLEKRARVRARSFVTTTMRPEGKWLFTVTTEVHEDSPKAASLEIELDDTENNPVWRHTEQVPASAAERTITAGATLANIRPWSPENPALYRFITKMVAPGEPPDVTWFRVGFRQIEVRGSKMLLNGEPITLRGVNRHEFMTGVSQTVPASQNRRDMEDIKALGANFVRLAHYSQSQDVYDDCDELGLLVWSEMPAWQSSAETLSSTATWNNDAMPQLRQIVHQHRNHPSVILWSVANEIPSDKQEVADYIDRAIEYVHLLDPTRLVTFASNRGERDIAMATEDVISVNEYYGWYSGKLEDVGPMLDRMHQKYPDKPILVSEFGSEAVAGWKPETAKAGSKNYSYEYQTRFLESHLAQIYALERSDFVAGGAVWVYSDFADPHRINGDQPDDAQYRNSKGLVSMKRVKKPAYFVVRDFYHHLSNRSEVGDTH